MKKHLLGIEDLSAQGKINGDVTHDEKISTGDLLKLKKYFLGIIEEADLAK